VSDQFRDTFQRTLDGLDAGIQVRHVATFDLESCKPEDTVESVLERDDWRIFSQVLVRRDGHAVGILERKGADATKTVAQQMHSLSDAMLISADASLSEFLNICQHDYFRLVVDRTRIAGIVTVSDLQKLPVRLHAFTRICHLEMLIAKVIKLRCRDQDESWRQYLGKKEVRKAEKMRSRYEHDDLTLPLIEYTDFGDKVRVVCGLFVELAADRPELEAVEGLRHEIMHARPVDESKVGVESLLKRLNLTGKWIDRLHDLLAPKQNEEKAD
jgi:hypothetical protein